MPTISVIVPVYNVEIYLHRCVDSILAQTFTDFELILVDDGSPDNCGAICDEYAKKDSRVRVIHKENGGQSSARNRAIEAAQGEWIHFVDSDDLIHPQMLEILYRAAQESGANISACSYTEAEDVENSFFAPYPMPPQYTLAAVSEEKLMEYRDGKKGHYWIVVAKLLRKEIVERERFLYVFSIYRENCASR